MEYKHKSGYIIRTVVHNEYTIYLAGFIIVNPDGLETNRITLDATQYRNQKDAETASFEAGKRVLSLHLSKSEPLDFYS